MDAFCWTHAINMSLGSQIVQIKRSLEVAREYHEDHRHATFHRNGFYEYGVIHRLANLLLGTFRIKYYQCKISDLVTTTSHALPTKT
jgi:pyruvate-formate lyase-activating enzyme